MAYITPWLATQFFDADGKPLTNGKVYSYVAGSTIPTDTYTDASATSANTNPIILDASGEADIWLDSDIVYKFVIQNENGVTLKTVDYVDGLGVPGPPGPVSHETLAEVSTNSVNQADNTYTLDGVNYVITDTGSLAQASTALDSDNNAYYELRYNKTVDNYVQLESSYGTAGIVLQSSSNKNIQISQDDGYSSVKGMLDYHKFYQFYSNLGGTFIDFESEVGNELHTQVSPSNSHFYLKNSGTEEINLTASVSSSKIEILKSVGYNYVYNATGTGVALDVTSDGIDGSHFSKSSTQAENRLSFNGAISADTLLTSSAAFRTLTLENNKEARETISSGVSSYQVRSTSTTYAELRAEASSANINANVDSTHYGQMQIGASYANMNLYNGSSLTSIKSGSDSVLSNGLSIGDTFSTTDGVMRFHGGDLQGYVGGAWKSLTAAGTGSVGGSGTPATLAMWDATGASIEDSPLSYDSFNTQLVYTESSSSSDLVLKGGTSTASQAAATLSFYAKDDGGSDQIYASINSVIVSPTSGAEEGRLDFRVPVAGSNTTLLQLTGSTLKVLNDLTVSGTVNGATIKSSGTANEYLDGTGNYSVPSSGSVGGSGTINYVPKFTPDGATLGDSSITDDGSTVAIGATLQTNGFIQSNSGQYITLNETAGNTAGFYLRDATSGSPVTMFRVASGGSAKFYDDLNVSDVFFVDKSTELVGVGTITPTYKLQVNAGTGVSTKAERVMLNTAFTTIRNSSTAGYSVLELSENETVDDYSHFFRIQKYGSTAASADNVNFIHKGAGVTTTILTIDGTTQDLAINVDTTVDANLSVTDNISSTGQIYSEEFTATSAVDWNNGNTQEITLSGATTFTFANGNSGASYLLKVQEDGSAITWPSTVHWPGNTAPTLSASGKVDIFTFYYSDGVYYGMAGLNFVA